MEKALPALIGAFTGAAVTLIGWIINHFLRLRQDKELRLRDATLQHLRAQLSELYGPLFALIEESKSAYRHAQRRLRSEDKPIQFENFNGDDPKVWDFFVEEYFIPLNTKVTTLIQSKPHLIDAESFPESFSRFLVHKSELESLHGLWKDRGVASNEFQRSSWPEEFSIEVKNSLESLRKRYESYVASRRT